MTEFIKTIDGEFVRADKIVSIKKTADFDNVDSHPKTLELYLLEAIWYSWRCKHGNEMESNY